MRLFQLGLVSLTLGTVAVTSIGCSDPVLPTPQGAWAATFQSVAGCQISSHNAKVGDIDGTNRGSVLVDGTDSATVSCTVSGSTSFSVDASASRKGSALSIVIPSLSPKATIDDPSKGTVSYSSPQTVKAYYADQDHQCDFYFAEGTKQRVAAGQVWVSFRCPAIIGENKDTCGIMESYALFENCEQ
jgi:hypothetical protein